MNFYVYGVVCVVQLDVCGKRSKKKKCKRQKISHDNKIEIKKEGKNVWVAKVVVRERERRKRLLRFGSMVALVG